MAKEFCVLGIDPGSQITGAGIVRQQDSRLLCLAAESIRLPRGDLGPRLGRIYERVSCLITEYSPQAMAIERVFLARNPQSALVLGHARGVAMLAGVNAGLEIYEYSATEIKQSVVGRGRADKRQVQHMMKVLLGLPEVPEEDASDALACAVSHIHYAQVSEKIARAAK
jgi:crossover junction endodeoxyribonuclease RuvC